MQKIEETDTHYTMNTKVGNIADSFFYLTYWYYENHLLLTVVRGMRAAENEKWIAYLNNRGIKYELVGKSCIIMPESVEQLFMDEGTFDGPCEVYVCRRKPEPETVPVATYMPEIVNFNENIPASFKEDIEKLGAHVYMSGERGGINIAHTNKEEIIYFVRDTS